MFTDWQHQMLYEYKCAMKNGDNRRLPCVGRRSPAGSAEVWSVVDAYESMGRELTLRGKTDKAVRLGDAVDDAVLAIGLKPGRAMKNGVVYKMEDKK